MCFFLLLSVCLLTYPNIFQTQGSFIYLVSIAHECMSICNRHRKSKKSNFSSFLKVFWSYINDQGSTYVIVLVCRCYSRHIWLSIFINVLSLLMSCYTCCDVTSVYGTLKKKLMLTFSLFGMLTHTGVIEIKRTCIVSYRSIVSYRTVPYRIV